MGSGKIELDSGYIKAESKPRVFLLSDIKQD
jgi:hypothetical protein